MQICTPVSVHLPIKIFPLPHNTSQTMAYILPVSPEVAVGGTGAARRRLSIADEGAPLHFNVSHVDSAGAQHHVVTLLLNKRHYRTGESIKGMLDFSRNQVRTNQARVILQTRETVSDQFRRPGRDLSTKQVMWTSTLDVAATHVRSSDFIFTFPSLGSTSFECDIVSVVWELVFTFSLEDGSSLLWALPVTVLPCAMEASPQTVYRRLFW